MEATFCSFCHCLAAYTCSYGANYCNEHQIYHDRLLGEHKTVNG